ncbi:MAG: tRNA 4-thiouridine(8) synthase ThiI [Lentisphaerae bacterium]|jgi:tRNA uracil 4-sulfurtransferase|nr:tRNA 4-thiouridine(8) synthase ThiI [Lentisphaerota bacterium]MBT4821552.1 tRNA 4-thiouridine(8) synthase ThiI [Lentisphaerota bacterium]MBT5610297.1 tRNA 4-thiouridine(8) synthase ThiI [Lentisphaerota bacterium]MBT7056412.1 tRNA 4-thiouridine(8) synthase ThiI [Lentisphaerota bacterium]MBT7848216.1 tRNA 4-thiouridine(8) synthase ThiI [Lentisphaerota bacterium]
MNPLATVPLPYNALICRYNEIATKGKNRTHFEDLLVRGLRRQLEGIGKLRITKERGRIFARLRDEKARFTPEACQILRERVPRVMGAASVSPGFLVTPEMSAIEETVDTTFMNVYDAYVQSRPKNTQIRYAMRARRNFKAFPLKSKEIEIHFAERFLHQCPQLTVDLNNPEMCVDVEVRHKRAFISYERIPGPGGLPTGSSGKLLALLSGGIDSPVACYQMMKRGCQLNFITFHSAPYTPPELLDKVGRLVTALNGFQQKGRLIAVNLLPAQKLIRELCQDRLRTVLYRRLMMRIATHVARMLGDQALATGDNIGQVASQTLENLSVISRATDLLIMRPLLTFDKFETVALANKIGTFDISKHEVPDSCTVFAPQRPATASILEDVEAEEAKLDADQILTLCLAETHQLELPDLTPIPLTEPRKRSPRRA